MSSSKAFLTTVEVSDRYAVSVDTVKRWRRENYGPVPIKIGRGVRYPMNNVLAWEDAQKLGEVATNDRDN